MKAFLLAGGRGERLRPLTLTIPKCLAPINGTPVLAVWLDLLEREGIDEVLLNVSHHVTQVQTFLRARTRGPRVHLSIENEPIGTAGSVRANRSLVDGDESFWILYADNLTDVRLQPIRDLHARHDGVLTIGLFHAPNPRAAGIVTLDETARVVDFIEKPSDPRGDLASAGIYLARPSLFDNIPDTNGLVDFGHDVLPRLVGNMSGCLIEDFLMDIGTPAALSRASEAWARRAACGARG